MQIDNYNVYVEDVEEKSVLVLVHFKNEINTFRSRFDLSKRMFIDETPIKLNDLQKESLVEEIKFLRSKLYMESRLMDELAYRFSKSNFDIVPSEHICQAAQTMSLHRIANSLDALHKLAEESRELGDIADALTQLSLYVKKI